ncbi:MAG: hypothetical protein U1G07_02515 [Verrucomicrobiota bacterium]
MNATPTVSLTTAERLSPMKPTRITRPLLSGTRLIPALLLGIALVGLTTGQARASDPIGIYAIIDKAVLEPNADAPERIQLFGTFSLARPGGYRDQYAPPQSGYLYYKLKPGEKEVCEREWADLKSLAGKGQAIGFASRFREMGRLRKADEKPGNPDEYPVASGIVKIKGNGYPPVQKLYEAAHLDPAKANPNDKGQSSPKSK